MTEAIEDDSQSQPAVELVDVSQEYPGVRALVNVNFRINAGEVHALLGQNGAGKSTLIKILAGVERPRHGALYLGGVRRDFRSPRESLEAGIGTIFQELSLVGHLSVAENLALGGAPVAKTDGQPPRWRPVVSWQRMRASARAALAAINAAIDVDQRVETLTVAQQQLVELAKALRRDAKVILLDEPTATLPDHDVEQLFNTMRHLRTRGVAMLYISHRLDEVYQIADRITVLRDGHLIGTYTPDGLPRAVAVRAMLGKSSGSSHGDALEDARRSFGNGGTDEPVLVADAISDGGRLRDVSLTLHRGEVLGIAGLVGSGQTELMECLFGARRCVVGMVTAGDGGVVIHDPRQAIAHGLGLLPAERKSQGLVLDMSVLKNTTIASIPRFTRGGVIRGRAETAATRSMMSALGMKVHSPSQRTRTLSGGTQQKVVLAKWLVGHSKVLLFDEPTRGIDVGAKGEIYKLIETFVADGGSVLLASSELAEILMCDRVLILAKGRLVGEILHENMDRRGERVLEMFA